MDPVLLTYQIDSDSRLYDLSSDLEPMSVRDQMFRGYILIKRLLAQGIIQENQEIPILIVGAGVAGAMAAMVAVGHRVPVVLSEESEPLTRLASCYTRYVCPTQYDWPAPHWAISRYPWSGQPMPLEWSINSASIVALEWQSKLRNASSLNPKLLRIESRRRFIKHDVDRARSIVNAYFDPPLPREPLECSLAIACAGFGSERCSLSKDQPTYRGYAFWDADEYGKPNLGILGRTPNVLISGGGDGALQDFLRIVTNGRPASSIYKSLPEEYKESIEQEVRIVEDHAQRAAVWARQGLLDHPINQRLQRDYQAIIDNLLAVGWKKIAKSLDPIVGSLTARLRIKLVHPCDHFSSCYALNRFLVLLLEAYLSRRLELRVIRPETKVVDIEGAPGHQCLDNPSLCHGRQHVITIADADCNTFPTAGQFAYQRTFLDDGPFDVVIVRHGIKSNNPPLGKSAAAPRRQLIPYDYPW